MTLPLPANSHKHCDPSRRAPVVQSIYYLPIGRTEDLPSAKLSVQRNDVIFFLKNQRLRVAQLGKAWCGNCQSLAKAQALVRSLVNELGTFSVGERTCHFLLGPLDLWYTLKCKTGLCGVVKKRNFATEQGTPNIVCGNESNLFFGH